LRRTLHEPQTMLLQGTTEAQPWKPALLALESALQGPANGTTAASVILSNQFLRYTLVPWRAELADSQEDLSYARHCFTKVYGRAALQWEIRLSQQALETPRVASAVDPELLDGLRSVCQRAGIGLRSVQPHLMAAFNSAKLHLRQRSAWLALLEPGHLCLALLHDGEWSRVRSMRLEGSWREELPPILEREAFLANDPAAPHEVWVGHLEHADLTLPEIDSWQFHALAPAHAAGPASAEGAAPLATAVG
jgi:hypothetical protein